MAQIATGNTDDALDILQEAMFKLVEKYATKTAEEWGPLFTTILQSKINDWHRKQQKGFRFFAWLSKDDDEQDDPIQNVKDDNVRTPEQYAQAASRIDSLEQAIHALPLRQQQVFLLRNWEGLNVEETAKAMSISGGSVKTHYSRAVQTLRTKLGDHWEQNHE